MSKALKEAIEANDPHAARTAVKKIKDINRKLPGAKAPLAYACQHGADQVLDILFEAGAVAEKRHMFIDEKPFVIAAHKGKTAVLKRFLELKKVSAETLQETIEDAAFNGHAKALDFLLNETKAPVDLKLVRLATTKSSAPRLLKILLKYCDVNARFKKNERDGVESQTILHEVASTGKAELLRILLEAGADGNARDNLGTTPLMVLAGHLNDIRFVNEQTKRTQQQLASGEAQLLSGEAPELRDAMLAISTLLGAGADARAKDNFGNDAIDYCRQGYRRDRLDPPEDVLTAFRKAGAQGDDVTRSLFEALRKDDLEAVRSAISSGADVNRRTPPPHSHTPLQIAVSADQNAVAFVRELLKGGANPNLSPGGETPLMFAARYSTVEVIKELVQAGADLHTVYHCGEAVENAYSSARNNEEVRAFLKSLGADNPKYEKPLEPGVASWNDFNELLVKSDPRTVANALAKLIGGKVTADAYGRSFTPGQESFVVIRPKKMDWSNVFRITPRGSWHDPVATPEFALELAKASNSPVLTLGYSDAADAAAFTRFTPDGKQFEDKGWDFATLEEFVGEMGDEAPAWAKKQLANSDEDDLTSSERLVALAEQEKFVVAAFGFAHEPGKKFEIELHGFGPEAFDHVAFISTE